MPEPACVIVGAGHAAAQLAPSLRQEGWQGRILLVGDEPWWPYNRPPLSKTFLAGEKSVAELLIRPPAAYDKLGVEARLGRRVQAIDRAAGTVRLDDGEHLPYTRLVLATGARVRRVALPGSGLPGVFHLRGIADVEAIRQALPGARRAVIVGGGYIGLETAAMLRQLGLEVAVLEMTPRVLCRVTAPEVSRFYTRIHREAGVALFTGARVSELRGRGRVAAVRCADGSELACDLVIFGIGVQPNEELAAAAGLSVDDGILVDSQCRTSDPAILAVGDCTRHYSALYGRHVRLESVPNAMDQARVAAATACGGEKEYNALPWFWSDQYDLKLQIAGLSSDYDDLVLRGDPDDGRQLAAFYFKEGILIAVDAVNNPQAFMLGKQLIAARARPDRRALADPAVAFRDLLPARGRGAGQGGNPQPK